MSLPSAPVVNCTVLPVLPPPSSSKRRLVGPKIAQLPYRGLMSGKRVQLHQTASVAVQRWKWHLMSIPSG